ncbi:MAG: DUF3800 domain-containing protein [Curtobacterium sp.]
MRTAYVDESEPAGRLDHTVYVMAAVLIDASDSDDVRAAVLRATPKRIRKLHWYEALGGQRLTWLGLLTRAVSVVVVRYDRTPARSERRRRRCIERLVWELEQRDVHALVVESRSRIRDASDVSMLESLRDRGIGRRIRYEHVRGSDEPLLALADIACGAHARGLLQPRSSDALVLVQ